MHFGEIMRFRRTSAGKVPLAVLQALGLPMPADVLEQFVFDHGTNEQFQRQYANLNLNALQWELSSISYKDILACSVYPPYADWTETVAARTRVVPTEGWRDILLPPQAIRHWQDHGTWIRPPIMLTGKLVGAARSLHLVEGHTRVGALRGLYESGVVLPNSHLVWLAKPRSSPHNDGPWREVLRTERMPFLDWLMAYSGDEGDLGILASSLIDAEYSSVSRIRVEGDNLDSVLAYADACPDLTQFKDAIQKAHEEWEQLLTGAIGPFPTESK